MTCKLQVKLICTVVYTHGLLLKSLLLLKIDSNGINVCDACLFKFQDSIFEASAFSVLFASSADYNQILQQCLKYKLSSRMTLALFSWLTSCFCQRNFYICSRIDHAFFTLSVDIK